MPSPVRYAEVKKLLHAAGWRFDRISGSHHIFTKAGKGHFSIPVHNGKVKFIYVRKIQKIG